MECDCGATPAFRAVGNTIELEEAAKPRHSEARTSHSPRVTAARQAHPQKRENYASMFLIEFNVEASYTLPYALVKR
eukprot:1186039-Prorocentrum_minimum.AAC.2